VADVTICRFKSVTFCNITKLIQFFNSLTVLINTFQYKIRSRYFHIKNCKSGLFKSPDRNLKYARLVDYYDIRRRGRGAILFSSKYSVLKEQSVPYIFGIKSIILCANYAQSGIFTSSNDSYVGSKVLIVVFMK
jgi:hypothetical protein